MSSVGTSLLEAVKVETKQSGFACAVATIRGDLSASDAADLDTLLADPRVVGSALARALTARGHRVTGPVVQRHRRGDCRCAA